MFEGMTDMEVIKLLLPIIIVELGIKVFCLFKLAKDEVKFMPKAAWAVIILLVSTFGPVSYLIVGRVKD